MIGELTPSQIDHLIRSQTYGRLGCGSPERLYVVPLSFVYEDPFLYAHSKEGTKIRTMRANESVCLFRIKVREKSGRYEKSR